MCGYDCIRNFWLHDYRSALTDHNAWKSFSWEVYHLGRQLSRLERLHWYSDALSCILHWLFASQGISKAAEHDFRAVPKIDWFVPNPDWIAILRKNFKLNFLAPDTVYLGIKDMLSLLGRFPVDCNWSWSPWAFLNFFEVSKKWLVEVYRERAYIIYKIYI